MLYVNGSVLNRTVNLKKSCAKYRDGTLVTHSFCMDFCSLAASNKKVMHYEKSIIYFISILGFR